MSLEVILLVLSAIMTVLALSILAGRSRANPQKSLSQSQESAYTNLGWFARMLKILSINLHPGLFVVIVVLLSLSLAFLLVEAVSLAVVFTPIISVLLIVAILFCTYELSMYRRRRFEANLSEAIEIMQAASVAGATPQGAIESVAKFSRKDIKSEFQRLSMALQYGATIESATARISALYDSEATRMLVQVLIARWSTGGRLDVLLASVAKMIRERLSMRLKVAGRLSGAKMSAIFMAIAPYALIPFFVSNQPQWLQVFLEHPYGLKALGGAMGLQLCGAIWLRQVLKVAL